MSGSLLENSESCSKYTLRNRLEELSSLPLVDFPGMKNNKIVHIDLSDSEVYLLQLPLLSDVAWG